MRAFLIQHVDSLITMAGGACMAVFAVRRANQLRASKNRLVRNMHILGLILVGIGIARFAFESFATYSWRRVATSDGKASAEFPVQPTTETATDTFEGLSVTRVSLKCEVPYRDIKLRLTWSEIPPEGPALTAEERIAGMKAFFEEHGLVVSSCLPENLGSVPCYRMVVERDGGKVRVRTRIAITPRIMYRVIAESSSGFHDDPAIERFMDSFSIGT